MRGLCVSFGTVLLAKQVKWVPVDDVRRRLRASTLCVHFCTFLLVKQSKWGVPVEEGVGRGVRALLLNFYLYATN